MMLFSVYFHSVFPKNPIYMYPPSCIIGARIRCPTHVLDHTVMLSSAVATGQCEETYLFSQNVNLQLDPGGFVRFSDFSYAATALYVRAEKLSQTAFGDN